MLVGIMSDVHCNHLAMDYALDRLSGQVDELWLAGDAVLAYRFSNEVIERVRAHDMAYVAGNHELGLLSPAGARALSSAGVSAANVERMAAAPMRYERTVSAKRVVMVHGNWREPYDAYLFPGSRHLAACSDLDADILVVGHTHVPMAERVGRVLVVNPGSLGQGGDPDDPGMLSYAVLDTDSDEVTHHRFAAAELAAG